MWEGLRTHRLLAEDWADVEAWVEAKQLADVEPSAEDTRSAEDGRSAEVRPTAGRREIECGRWQIEADSKLGQKNIRQEDKLGARKSDVEEEYLGGRIGRRTSKKAICRLIRDF
ncbi:hypothetical protein E6C27_scaffold468G00690 [Cucumis melo var. makuwa]|uniref:Uncharacterized protein n=1 Tax=Cucumis melo var. makuwa TaxID=1194695 RepID=A0A5A7V403_CUCMM|nr:hypothetical protein E6C27_scaffold468G00690 [Cucumis melo var. makuwa]